jgi:predicted GIY-YIG superfamily endonuclease
VPRLSRHASGVGARWPRRRPPVWLFRPQPVASASEAQRHPDWAW